MVCYNGWTSNNGLNRKHMDPKDVIMEDCDKMWGAKCPNSHG